MHPGTSNQSNLSAIFTPTMRYATILVSVLIIIAVLVPRRNLPDVNIGGYDKLIHMAMFAAWAIAVRYDAKEKSFRPMQVFMLGLGFSVLTEILQLLVEGRSFDVYDVIADALGLAIGLLISGPVVTSLKKLIR
jgi:VanZ family protein